jgi:hypothetical protein
MSRDQADLFPGHTAAHAAADRQAGEWSPPAPSTPPSPRWVAEWGKFERDAAPGHVPALPECDRACPWRKPLRVRIAERAMTGQGIVGIFDDECWHPDKNVRDIEDHEVCWPTLASLRLGAPGQESQP